ncbi:MAG: hypothetical protein QXK15_00150 [Candidatus Bathyarchaeia archaeon]
MVKDRGCEVIRIKVNNDLSINKGDLKEKIVENSVSYTGIPNNSTGYISTQDFEVILKTVKKKLWSYLECTLHIYNFKVIFKQGGI